MTAKILKFADAIKWRDKRDQEALEFLASLAEYDRKLDMLKNGVQSKDKAK